MTDKLHTNQERIDKIRCLMIQVDTLLGEMQANYKTQGLASIRLDVKVASDCLKGLETFIKGKAAEDCI